MSLISEETWEKLWPGRVLSKPKFHLLKAPPPVMCCAYVNLEYKGQLWRNMPNKHVLQGQGPSLFGRNWLESVCLDWCEIHSVVMSSLQEVLDRHQPVFQPGLSKMRRVEAKPHYYWPRSVPYALTGTIEEEQERLVEEGTLEPIETANWAAPIVPVLKSNKKSIRISDYFCFIVNPVAKLDNCPIPKVETFFREARASLNWTSNKPYQQLPLEEDSKDFVVIKTHKGLFRYTPLPYGVASAPGISNWKWRNCWKGLKVLLSS